MTAGRRYLLGLGAVAAATSALSFVLPHAERRSLWLALGTGLAVQGPLGWWLVRSLGTDRFLLVWATGIGTRVVLVGLWGLLVARTLRLHLAPALLALVAVLLAFLVVEVAVIYTRQAETEVR